MYQEAVRAWLPGQLVAHVGTPVLTEGGGST